MLFALGAGASAQGTDTVDLVLLVTAGVALGAARRLGRAGRTRALPPSRPVGGLDPA